MARIPAVSHKTVTLTQPIPMPRHTHLLQPVAKRRKGAATCSVSAGRRFSRPSRLVSNSDGLCPRKLLILSLYGHTVGVHAASHMLEPACARLSHGSGSTATRCRFTVPVAEKSSVPSSAKTSVRNGPLEVCPSLLMCRVARTL
jgi:hypothetical protein